MTAKRSPNKLDKSAAFRQEQYQAAQQLRLRAIRAQLKAAFNLCWTAENSIPLHKLGLGRDAVNHAEHTAHWIDVHLAERQHVPVDSIGELREALAELVRQISSLKKQIETGIARNAVFPHPRRQRPA